MFSFRCNVILINYLDSPLETSEVVDRLVLFIKIGNLWCWVFCFIREMLRNGARTLCCRCFFLLLCLWNRTSFHPHDRETTFHERTPNERNICLQFFTSRRKIEVLPSLIIRILTKKTLVQNLFFRLFTVETNLPWTNFKSKYFPRENSR